MNSIKYLNIISLLIIKKIDSNYTANIEFNYHYNTDYINIKSYLSFYIDNCESGGFKFSNINHMIINTISCMCNMSYKHFSKSTNIHARKANKFYY